VRRIPSFMRRVSGWLVAAVLLLTPALAPATGRAGVQVATCKATGSAVATPVSSEFLPGAYTWTIAARGTCAAVGLPLRTVALEGRTYSPGSGNPYAGLHPFPSWFEVGISITNPKTGNTWTRFQFLNLVRLADIKAVGAYALGLYHINSSRYGDGVGAPEGAGELTHTARTQTDGVYVIPFTTVFVVTPALV
jgi:hypothetical protein